MNKISLIDSFSELKSEKRISKPAMMKILEETFRTELIKKFNTDEGFDIIMNPDNGDLEIWRTKLVVDDGEVEDHLTQISISDVRKIEPDFEVGEEYSEEFKISDIGRRSILNIRQNLKSKIKTFENKNIIDRFNDMIGYQYSGELQSIKRNMAILTDADGVEIILPRGNQIPGEFYKKGHSIKGVIESVEIVNSKPVVTISRTSPEFLISLLEEEISEVLDGIITVKEVFRVPGIRAKVVVEAYDDRIDPVGICVGVRGSRINLIVKELNGENIDIINWSENKKLFLSRCLKINPSTKIDIENEVANIYIDAEEIGKVMGKGSSNINLASKLTGYKINIFSDGSSNIEEDIELVEFSDEIDQWIIDEFIKAGFDTAKSVLSVSIDDIVRKTDLETETVIDVFSILKEEFEN